MATDPTAVKVRAEDGRHVEGVDISPFISNLPFGRDTTCFRTPDASGSTSQVGEDSAMLEDFYVVQRWSDKHLMLFVLAYHTKTRGDALSSTSQVIIHYSVNPFETGGRCEDPS